MNDELIYIEPGQDALMVSGELTVACRSVPEAYLMWGQLELNEKERAVIQVGDEFRGRHSEDAGLTAKRRLHARHQECCRYSFARNVGNSETDASVAEI